MRFTREQHPDAIARYAHVRPARGRRTKRCGAGFPGGTRACTLELGHNGPHVAHGLWRRVMAVWDGGGVSVGPTRSRSVAAASSRARFSSIGPLAVLDWLWRRLTLRTEHFLEELGFLLFFVGMLVFVIDWALRMLGVR